MSTELEKWIEQEGLKAFPVMMYQPFMFQPTFDMNEKVREVFLLGLWHSIREFEKIKSLSTKHTQDKTEQP